jgi:hypothetical protein
VPEFGQAEKVKLLSELVLLGEGEGESEGVPAGGGEVLLVVLGMQVC